MKTLTLFSLIFILTQSNLVAQKPNLDGFKNLKWGLSEQQAYKSIDPKDKSWHYDLRLDGGNEIKIEEFAGRKLEQAFLYFYKDKLCRVSIYFVDNAVDSYSKMKRYNPKWDIGEDELESLFNEIMSEIDKKYFPCVREKFNCKWIFNDGNYIELGGREKNASLRLSYVNNAMEVNRIRDRESDLNEIKREKREKNIKDY